MAIVIPADFNRATSDISQAVVKTTGSSRRRESAS
jgi:hypothetical protein